jgi:hypothetical protein
MKKGESGLSGWFPFLVLQLIRESRGLGVIQFFLISMVKGGDLVWIEVFGHKLVKGLDKGTSRVHNSMKSFCYIYLRAASELFGKRNGPISVAWV